MRARAGQPVRGAARVDGCPPAGSGYCRGLRRWQGPAPAGRSGAAGTPAAGEAAHAGWPAAALAAVQVSEDLSAQVTEGLVLPGPLLVPDHLLMPPGGRRGGCRSLLVVLPRG